MTTLKPCPFCGKEVKFNHSLELEPNGVVCHTCGYVYRPFRLKPLGKREQFEKRMNEIARMWNRRKA